MSKAFTKEDDGGDVLVGRPIARGGEPRPITRAGHAALAARLVAIEAELAALDPAAPEAALRKPALAHERERCAQTLADVRVVEPPAAPAQVTFGCTVRVKGPRGERSLTLVGPDESDARAGRISSASPVGQALLGAAVGDEVALRTPSGVEGVEILAILGA